MLIFKLQIPVGFFESIPSISINLVVHPGGLLAPAHTVPAELVDVVGDKAALGAGQGHKATAGGVQVLGLPAGAPQPLSGTEGGILGGRPGPGQVSLGLLIDHPVNVQLGAVPPGLRQPGTVTLRGRIHALPSPWEGREKGEAVKCFGTEENTERHQNSDSDLVVSLEQSWAQEIPYSCQLQAKSHGRTC